MPHSSRKALACARLCLTIGADSADYQYMLNIAQITAYFAVFNALCEVCADIQIPDKHHPSNKQAWDKAYRTLRHSAFSERTERLCEGDVTSDLIDFLSMGTFLKLQRNKASYDYWHNPTPEDAMNSILLAEKALSIMEDASHNDKSALANCLLNIKSAHI